LKSHLSLDEARPSIHLQHFVRPSADKQPLVFVYDPNEQLLRYIEQVLSPAYQLEIFTTPASLLEAMDQDQIPDLTMLAWSSLDISLKVLQDVTSRDKRHPIILLSASSNSEEIARAIKLGASGVIQKPFHHGDLKIARQTCKADSSR
jgi:DNA-binding NtrC family response regulator